MNEFLHIGLGQKINVLLVLVGLVLSSADVTGSTGLTSKQSEAGDVTLKSLSYKIGEDSHDVAISNFNRIHISMKSLI